MALRADEINEFHRAELVCIQPTIRMRTKLLTLTAALCFALSLHAQIFQPITCKNSFTREQESAEGDKVVAEVYRTMPVLPDSDPVSQYVQQMGARLVAAAPLTPGFETQWPFRFHVVASSEINAFALPGGTMFVNLGAIQAAETEAQLAGVMGHEMSHVILRHSTCNITKQQHRSVFYGIAKLGAAVTLGEGAASGIGMVQNLSYLKMSRGDEQQADLLGAQISHNAGYDPRGLPQFFEIITAKYGQGGAQFLSDHPNPGNRTQYVNAEIAQLTPLPNPIVNTEGFRRVRAQATALPTYSSKQMSNGEWKTTGLYASSPGPYIPVTMSAPQATDRGTLANRGASAPYTASNPDTTPSGSSGQSSSTSSSVSAVPLPALGLADPLVRYQATQWSILAPKRWVAKTSSEGTVTLAAPAGNGDSGLAYGLYAGFVKQPGNGIGTAADLSKATETLAQQLGVSSALRVADAFVPLTIAGRSAGSETLTGASPVTANGTPLPEHDWLITVARPDGDLDFFLFVCPERDFAQLRPLFVRMRDSIRP